MKLKFKSSRNGHHGSSSPVDRVALLKTLEAVSPGLSSKGLIQQSSCFCFRNGVVFTFNDRVAVRAPSGLPKSFSGAIQSGPLLTLLRRLPDEDLLFKATATELRVTCQGSSRKGGVRMDAEVVLPITNADEPPEEGSPKWKELDSSFGEAVTLTQPCAARGKGDEINNFIHVHPDYLEANDEMQMIRYRVKTELRKPFLVRASAATHLPHLDVCGMAETKNWVHFKNQTGVVFSCLRADADDYNDLGKNLKTDGMEMARMPEGVKQAAENAGEFTKEQENGDISVKLADGRIHIKGEGVSGWYSEAPKIKYVGKPMEFWISPKLLAVIAERYSECYVGENRLVVKGKKWKYAVSFSDPKKDKEEATEEASESEDWSEESSV